MVRQGRVQICVTACFCVSMALSLCILPLKLVSSWLLAIAVHEVFHCIAALGCGSTLRRIRITMLGAEIVADGGSPGCEIISSLAGPVGSLLLLLFRKTIPITALCALIHAIYNLLPLTNLDGGRALHSSLRLLLNSNRAETICNLIDWTVRILLLVGALFISWRMQWGALILFSVILLFRKNGRVKSTCKRKRLQLQ